MTYKVIALLIVVFLIGCFDHFPGPAVRNEFPEPIKVTIEYGDGKTYSHTWLPCQTVSIESAGLGRFGKDVSVDRIEVVKVAEGRDEFALSFGKETIAAFIEEEKKRNKTTVWVLIESGIHFSENRECESTVGWMSGAQRNK